MPLPSVATLAPGDIVWCVFPNAGNGAIAKARPALVISIMDDENPPRLRVAYGTTQRPRPYGRGDFLIEEQRHLEQAGLASITKFRMTNVVVIPFTEAYFESAPLSGGGHSGTPKMGTLPAALMPELQRAIQEAGLLPRPSRPTRSE